MEILGKILGNPARVKIMRLFIQNQNNSFSSKDVAKRSRVSPETARGEIRLLSSIGFIKKHGKNLSFNPSFKYALEFENILVRADSLNKQSLVDKFKKVGRVKLMIISGIFIKNPDSRVDFLIVGDKLKKGKIEDEMRKLEAEIGSELVYAVFDTKEFVYRLNMYDKLVRDILDFPHEVLLQNKELSTQALKKA